MNFHFGIETSICYQVLRKIDIVWWWTLKKFEIYYWQSFWFFISSGILYLFSEYEKKKFQFVSGKLCFPDPWCDFHLMDNYYLTESCQGRILKYLLSNTVFHQWSFSILFVFHQRLSSIKGCSPSEVVFHQSMSYIKYCRPPR